MALRFFKNAFRDLFSPESTESSPRTTSERSPDDEITRFIFWAKHFSRLKSEVKHRAFEPPPDLKLSVFRITGLTDPEAWILGRYIEDPPERVVQARADIARQNIVRHGLRVEPDEPPMRHHLIVDWPLEKDARISIAQQMAADAVLRLPADELPL